MESSYSQLEELNQLSTLTMRDVDFVNRLLPNHLRLEWIRKYHDMSQTERIQPLPEILYEVLVLASLFPGYDVDSTEEN